MPVYYEKKILPFFSISIIFYLEELFKLINFYSENILLELSVIYLSMFICFSYNGLKSIS